MAAVSRSACGTASGFTTVPSVKRSLDLSATKPPSAFALRGKRPPERNCSVSQSDAGFSDVEVRVSRINVHLPRLDQFTLDHLAATPVAPVIAAADPEVRKQIGASVMKQLQRYADGDGVTYPEETHVLTARVP